MKSIKLYLVLLVLLTSSLSAQDLTNLSRANQWEIGISFGEIPIMAGSFKPGISFGYHFNDYIYVGGIYQIVDHIQRDDDSFDAKGLGFNDLVSSRERVAPRAMLHARLRPHKKAPFLSLGIVSNGKDVETIEFGDAVQVIGNNSYEGPITVQLTRKSAIRPVFGIGYQYTFGNNVTVSTEWSFDWLNPVPAPEVGFTSDFVISEGDIRIKQQEITDEFKSNFHNRYHIFHLGFGYRF